MFSIYMDKENAGAAPGAGGLGGAGGAGLGVMAAPHPAPIRTAPVGKSFNQSTSEITSRLRGLRMGDVNVLVNTPRPNTAKHGSAIKRLDAELHKPQRAMKPPTAIPKVTVQQDVSSQPQRQYEEIEAMHVCDEKDTYEDLWPASERPATYAAAFRSWRPQFMFSSSAGDEGGDVCPPPPPATPPTPVHAVADDTLEELELSEDLLAFMQPPPLDDLLADQVRLNTH